MASVILRRVRAELIAVNVRKEGAEGDKSLALDLKFRAERVPSTVLRALVKPHEIPAEGDEVKVFDVLDAFFDPLTGQPKFQGLPRLAFDTSKFPLHFVGVDDMGFRGATARKFSVSLIDRDRCVVEFGATLKPSDHEAESILRRLGDVVWVRVEPEQGDMFDALIAEAYNLKRGDERLAAVQAIDDLADPGPALADAGPSVSVSTTTPAAPADAPPVEAPADPLYPDAVIAAREAGDGTVLSIANLQRRLKIGYNRAARLLEELEARGVVSAIREDGKRVVLPVAS
jgi:hypothetical protein